ncbi:hypothetical protein TKK_0004764 [Trichogramma kaykai]|uniref:SAM domain-containing protein n=1 Tax=Trichogramma kaykai TaxID=54128 RepID=A0ABD2XKS3_9HYME
MEAPLSSYWVNFFKNAGFPKDVATRYAVIFSNNRIKPDMLPDLDKPSLREMGITLMGDLIAILRYAKNVVDETKCQNLLNANDSPPAHPVKAAPKSTIKKANIIAKTTTAVNKVKADPSKVMKSNGNNLAMKAKIIPAAANKMTIKKKVASSAVASKLYSDHIEEAPKLKVAPIKRKFESESSDDEDLTLLLESVHQSRKRPKNPEMMENNMEYGPKVPPMKSQQIVKKPVQPKKTVFHRLGDSMVSSTTNVDSLNSSFTPSFTVTGVGKESQKRSSDSVFNRLGNKDQTSPSNGVIRSTTSILKTRVPMKGTKVLTTKAAISKVPVGTMRADQEVLTKKLILNQKPQPVITAASFKRVPGKKNNFLQRATKVPGKLASERQEISAKSRLGLNKQVTFKKIATVNHFRNQGTEVKQFKKQGVFSRLG